MSGLRDRAGDILATAANAEGVTDAIIATRDGLVALGNLRNAGDNDTVSAMAAASLAAAETAGLEVGAGRIEHIHAVCSGCDLLVAGLDDEYILILVAERGEDKAQAALDQARQELQTALAG